MLRYRLDRQDASYGPYLDRVGQIFEVVRGFGFPVIPAPRASVARDPDGVVRWQGSLPDGFAGGTVFVAERHADRGVVLRCLGLIASAERNPDVLTFDVIRSLIGELVRPKPPKRGFLRRR